MPVSRNLSANTSYSPVLIPNVSLQQGGATVPASILSLTLGSSSFAKIKINGNVEILRFAQQTERPINLNRLKKQLGSGELMLELVTDPHSGHRSLLLSEHTQDMPVSGPIFRGEGRIRTQQIALSALREAPPLWKDWYALGCALEIHEHLVVTLHDHSEYLVCKSDCFEHALKLNPHKAVAWNNLGATIGPEDRRYFSDGLVNHEYGRLECFIKAVQCEPALKEAWFNLANTLDSNQTITIDIQQGERRAIKVLTKKICEDIAHDLSKGSNFESVLWPDETDDRKLSPANLPSESSTQDSMDYSRSSSPESHHQAANALLRFSNALSDLSTITPQAYPEAGACMQMNRHMEAVSAVAGDPMQSELPIHISIPGLENHQPMNTDMPPFNLPEPRDSAVAAKRASPFFSSVEGANQSVRRSHSAASFDSIRSEDLVLEGREDYAAIIDVLSQIKYTPELLTQDDLAEFQSSVGESLATKTLNTVFKTKSGKNVRAIDFAASYGRPELAKILLDNGALNSKGQKGRLQNNLAEHNRGRYSALGDRISPDQNKM